MIESYETMEVMEPSKEMETLLRAILMPFLLFKRTGISSIFFMFQL